MDSSRTPQGCFSDWVCPLRLQLCFGRVAVLVADTGSGNSIQRLHGWCAWRRALIVLYVFCQKESDLLARERKNDSHRGTKPPCAKRPHRNSSCSITRRCGETATGGR